MGSIGLGYEIGDYEDGNANYPTALMHTANISCVNDYFSLTLGRQEIDLEWMRDFHEAYVGVITALPDTTIVVGHSQRKATADYNAVLETFADTGEHGAKVDYDTDMFGLTAHYAISNEKVTRTTDGDNINPLEDSNQVYEADANTIYFGVGYELDKLALNAMYGQTKYSSDKENEINVLAEYGISDEFVVGAIFVNVDAQDGDDDYNKFTFTANYTF
ncbi:hypothetical protein N8972_01385 [Sulfurospirillum sp.]|nr:hypothetical protein [Sulfurospirillum sp.]